MNLELLECFGQNYPEEFDGALDCISYAVTCAFNKYGTLLAVGCNDGRIVFWDFLTRGIAKVILAHIHPVSSLSWSRSGRKLLSACIDNTVCIWDVSSGELDKRYRFSYPIMKAQFHPRTETMLLVCPMKHAAVIVTEGDKRLLVPLDDESDLSVVASFDRKGSYVYTGNVKGKILVMTVPELQIKASFKVTTGASNSTSIKSIEFARRGDSFLVNTSDRIIRVYDGEEVVRSGRDGEPEPKQKLQDLVNKTMWKKCVFSGDGEYICAGSARQHSLYIWEKTVGNLVKILHGTKGELLLDVVWHPVRPIVTSISSGVVSVWAQPQVENWSAFAPDFKELDENVEYEERESEFDLEDEDRSPLLHTEMQDIDEEVDVVTVEPIPAFCSSDEDVEDTNALLYLPISPDIDEPEDTHSQSEDTAPEEPIIKKSPNECPPAKKRRTKAEAAECTLRNDTHPLLHSKGKEKASPQPKKTLKSRPQKSVSQSEGKSSYRPKHGGRKEKSIGA